MALLDHLDRNISVETNDAIKTLSERTKLPVELLLQRDKELIQSEIAYVREDIKKPDYENRILWNIFVRRTNRTTRNLLDQTLIRLEIREQIRKMNIPTPVGELTLNQYVILAFKVRKTFPMDEKSNYSIGSIVTELIEMFNSEKKHLEAA